MIGRLVSFALKQRFMIVIASIALMIYGAISFGNLPIDAYPDLAPPHVELITQWPGHAAEEIERLVTIPVIHRHEFRIRRRPVFRARAGV
jgi:cobalt-zinc-cadmium resistance protein CzcA